MPHYIYRAKVQDNGTVTYHNSKGQTVTYKTSNEDTRNSRGEQRDHKLDDAKLLFGTVNKYFTGNDPNITPAEQVKIKAEIAKQRTPMNDYGTGLSHSAPTLNVYEGIDFVLRTFSDEASEGGKNITPNEVYQIYEIFHSWTKEK